MEKTSKQSGSYQKSLFLWAILLIMIIGASAYLYYKHEKRLLRAEKTEELITIANFKIQELEHWIRERKANAMFTSQSPGFIRDVENYTANKQDTVAKESVLKRFTLLQTMYNYEYCHLVDSRGRILVTTQPGASALDSIFLSDLQKASSEKSVVMSDFRYCTVHKKIHIVFIVPVIDKQNKNPAFLVFQNDPMDYLYPLVQTWPGKSHTSETLLFEQDGDSVIFLNELRHKKNTALNFRIALTETDISAVKAIHGFREMVEGFDYRGKRVLSYITQIAGTPWFMISKIDNHEMFRDVRARGIMLLVILLFIVLFLIFGALYLANIRNKNVYKNLYEKEKALWDSQQEYRTMLYSIGDAVISTDRNGLIRMLNPVAEKLTGWNEIDALGRPLEQVFRIIHEHTRQEVISPVQKVIREGVITSLANHTLLISKTGQEYPISDAGAPIFDQERQLQGVVLVFRDQTQERAVIKQLEKSEEKFAIAFRSSPYAITLTKLDTGEIIDVNQGFEKITGYHYDEVIGKTTPELDLWASIHDRNQVVEELKKNHQVIGKEFQFRIKSGDLIYSIFNAEIISVGGEYLVLSSINDITKRKIAELDLIEAKERAEESERLKTIFLANMSHEIRTPMNAILGFSSLLNDPSFENDEKEIFMERINDSGRRLLRIITDIVDISKIESKQLRLSFSPCHVANLIYTSVDGIQTSGLLRAKQELCLLVTIPEQYQDLEIMTDAVRLQQVIDNLLTNAVKYTEAGEVEAGFILQELNNQPRIKFFVRDTGKGILPEKQELIFERFRQAEENDYHEGTGLGLSIAKGIVELFEGNMEVASVPNKGTTFHFSIPFIPVKSDKKQPAVETSHEVELTGKTIVIAEDSEDSFIYLKKLMESTKATIVHAKNGEELLQYLEKNEADLILLDLKMPKMNGYLCLQEIRKRDIQTRIIAQTAYAFPDDRQRCLREGCHGYLSKPIKKSELFSLILEVMGS